jgi:hypothetical protein
MTPIANSLRNRSIPLTGLGPNLHQSSAGAESYGLEYADHPRGTDCEKVVNGERITFALQSGLERC